MRRTTRQNTACGASPLLGNLAVAAAALFVFIANQPALVSAGDLPAISTADLCATLPAPSTLLESSDGETSSSSPASSSCQIFASWEDFATYLPTARDHLVLCAGSWLTRPNADAMPAIIKNNLRLTCSIPGKCRIRGPGRHLTIKTGDKKRVIVDGMQFEGSDFTSVVVVDDASGLHTFCGNTFVDNSRPADSPKGGGAIYAGLNTHLVIGQSVFRNNEARVGGAISFAGQSLTIVDSMFEDNTAVERGGAVETNVIGNGEEMIITGQSSSEDDGAIAGDEADASTKAVTSEGTNVAPSSATSANAPQRIEIGTSTFIDNSSNDDGGASGAILIASGDEWVDLGGNLMVGGTDNGCQGAYARSVSIAANNNRANDDANCLHFVGAGGEEIVLDPDQDSHSSHDENGNAPQTYEEEVAQALQEAAAEYEQLHGDEEMNDDCVPCTNLPTAHMISTGLNCNNYTYAYERRCGTEFGWWGRDGNPQHCQYSCWQNGAPYSTQVGRPCCDRDDSDDDVSGADSVSVDVDTPPLILGKGLYKHKDTDLHVAEGLTVRRFAKMFEPVSYTSANRRNLQESTSDKCTFPVNPDGAATFYDPRHNVDGGFTYCINSESKFSGGVYCVEFDADCHPMDFSKAVGGRAEDGCTEPTGGFVPNSWNCNGGTTPWNTWVTCEEVDVEEDGGGYCWQVDPYNERAPERISAIGPGEWEAMAVDDRTPQPIFFFTEDWSEGALRRFEPTPSSLPAGWHTLHGDGELSFLVFDDVTYEGSDITGTFYWSNNLKEGRKSQSQYFPNLEGITFIVVDGAPLLFFVSKTRRRLYRLNLDTYTWSSTTTQRELPDGGSFWNGPDMLVPVGQHFIFHTEDGGGTPGVFFKDLRTGQYLTIFQDEVEPNENGKYGEETTGLAVSPNGQCLLSCLQDRGECFVFERGDGGTFESLAPRLRIR